MSNEKSMSKSFEEFTNKVNSWKLVQRNGWAIKISILEEKNVMLLFASQYTKQSIIKYCSNQDEALEIINNITQKNAREYLELGY